MPLVRGQCSHSVKAVLKRDDNYDEVRPLPVVEIWPVENFCLQRYLFASLAKWRYRSAP